MAESGLLPDWIVRHGIRRLLARRIDSVPQLGCSQSTTEFANRLRCEPIAIEAEAANRQHYEVPPAFFRSVLGPRMKYSCCLFDGPDDSLAAAEEAMLDLTCERAQIGDGMQILELGCGWGSLSLWLAEHFPSSSVVAVSNSHRQREFITRRAAELSLSNLRVTTADVADFATPERFDRVVSIEMFEHMRNYEELLRRVSGWLSAEGLAFVHVFCHAGAPYLFEDRSDDDWMSRHFFTGGTMPSVDLFSHFDRDLRVRQSWKINGTHYWKTCEAWLRNLDGSRSQLLELFGEVLSPDEARVTLQRWRIFLLACSELFRYESGQRWLVGHYLFEKAE